MTEEYKITTLNQTVHPSIIWRVTEETRDYITNILDNALLPYLDETARFAFVFRQLPEFIFEQIYDITVDNEFPHHIMRGHEELATLG